MSIVDDEKHRNFKGFIFFKNVYEAGYSLSKNHRPKFYTCALDYLYRDITPTFGKRENDIRVAFMSSKYIFDSQKSGQKRNNPAIPSAVPPAVPPAVQEEEKKREEEVEREDIERRVSTLTSSISDSFSLPDSAGEVMELSRDKNVGIPCSLEQAEMYFTDRVSRDWIPIGQFKRINSEQRLCADLKKWLMRDKQKENTLSVDEQIKRIQGNSQDGKHIADSSEFTRNDEI